MDEKNITISIEDWTGRFVATIEVEGVANIYDDGAPQKAQAAFEDYCEKNDLTPDESAWTWTF